MEPVAIDIATPHGPARAHVHTVARAKGALVLGHGAGGGVSAPDLVAVTGAAVAAGVAVALVEQPYRVAGRRSPAPAPQLDAAWIAALEHLRAHELDGLRVVTGGRSSGARVACRTSAETGATGVLCLAFPLIAPSGASRLPELDAVRVPVLIVQGVTDRFGMPTEARNRRVIQVTGDHSLRRGLDTAGVVVESWLRRVTAG